MRKKAKWLCAVMAAVLCISTLAGCGNKEEKKEEKSTGAESTAASQAGSGEVSESKPEEVVTINLYMYNTADQAGEAEVIAAMNEYSAEKIGVTINFTSFSNSDYKDKLTMALAAKDDIDICWTASYTSLIDLAEQGALLELSDLLKEYQDLYQVMPEDIWESTRINKGLYCVPNYKECFVGYSVFTTAEMAQKVKEKYGIDFETIECNDIFEIGNYEEYILACMKEGVDMPIPGGCSLGKWIESAQNYELIASNYVMDRNTHKVYTFFEIPEYEDFIARNIRWRELGIWKEEQLMSDYKETPFIKAGSYAIFGAQTTPDNVNNYSTRYDNIPLLGHEAGEGRITSNANIGSGYSITASSTKAEACMKWLELLNTDTEFADLYVYGIEGKHYTRDAQGVVTKIKDSGWNNGIWKMTNFKVPSLCSTEALDKKEQYEQANAKAIKAETAGFRADLTSLANEQAAVAAVYSEYGGMLEKGFYGLDKLEEAIKNCKAAGSDKLTEELQKQIDAFFASK